MKAAFGTLSARLLAEVHAQEAGEAEEEQRS